MKLQAINGTFLELNILGYADPEASDDSHDSNWLRIQIDVHHQIGTWTATSACLLSNEAEELADWLEKLGRRERKGEDTELWFIEPNLCFRFHTDTQGVSFIQVCIAYEFVPSSVTSKQDIPDDVWVQWDRDDGDCLKEVWIQFPVSENDLNGAAASLRQQLARYPQRSYGNISVKDIKTVFLDE